MAQFNRVAFINYFLSQGFTFEVACEEADKGKRLHEADQAAFEAKLAEQSAAKAQKENDILLWDAIDAAGCEV